MVLKMTLIENHCFMESGDSLNENQYHDSKQKNEQFKHEKNAPFPHMDIFPGEPLNLENLDPPVSVHVVASLAKSYLRELPEPLLTTANAAAVMALEGNV